AWARCCPPSTRARSSSAGTRARRRGCGWRSTTWSRSWSRAPAGWPRVAFPRPTSCSRATRPIRRRRSDGPGSERRPERGADAEVGGTDHGTARAAGRRSAGQARAQQLLTHLRALAAVRLGLAEEVGELTVAVAFGVA